MTVAETRQAIAAGIDRARTAAGEGVTLLGTGEMGIGNTTPSTALICAFFDLQPADVTGRGTGLADDALAHKVQVVEKALARHRDRIGDPLETLAALGGFEIAALCGLVLGAAAHRIPVVVDGYISSAAAVAALRMQPLVRDYLFFSHLSAERGHAQLVQRLDVRPVLDLDLRLGEGTGAALAMTLIEAAVKVYNGMATFGSAGVSQQA
jgi:nicotinate-nucleotide--dimethylbenzimidazole phosphoribosyltransferase